MAQYLNFVIGPGVVEVFVVLYICSRLPEVDWSGGGCFWHVISYLKFVVGLGVVEVVGGL